MAIRFNANEVFEMAERAESNAAAFYRKAAELHGKGDTQNTEFLLKMAAMEDEHRATFAKMREELPAEMREETAYDPYLEANLYLDEMADSKAGEGAPAAAAELTGDESFADVVRTSVNMEAQAIAFYVGVKDMVSDKLGKDNVEAIIEEEKSHLVTLTTALRKLTDR